MFLSGLIYVMLKIFGYLRRHRPDVVMHLATESHVDRSIDGPGEFINTNVNGTFNLLEVRDFILMN